MKGSNSASSICQVCGKNFACSIIEGDHYKADSTPIVHIYKLSCGFPHILGAKLKNSKIRVFSKDECIYLPDERARWVEGRRLRGMDKPLESLCSLLTKARFPIVSPGSN